jgi:hypothetical protein
MLQTVKIMYTFLSCNFFKSIHFEHYSLEPEHMYPVMYSKMAPAPHVPFCLGQASIVHKNVHVIFNIPSLCPSIINVHKLNTA